MKWIDRKKKEIPNDIDVLVIWKGRFGILRKEGKVYCSICPGELANVIEMDQECYERIDYWSYLADPIFRNNQPERLNPEDTSNSVCDSLNTANK